MPNPISPYDLQLLRNQAAISRKILKLFEDGITSLTPYIRTITYKGKLFNLSDYPALSQKVNALMKRLQPQVYSVLVNGIKESWDLSRKKNDLLVDKRLAGKKIKANVRQALYDPNAGALKAFIARKERGLNLSDRVWTTIQPLRSQLEQTVGLEISKGTPATEIAKKAKMYLQEPDKLFRRVRDEEGKLTLSAAARNYHPGHGVYRSSYKNAFRLARTETNISYRKADHTRWQQLPFVIGIRVRLSNAHPRYDICDQLMGLYPKDFDFSGWHPQCICFATPELMSEEEYDKIEDQILAGQAISVPSTSVISRPPAAFSQYLKENKDKLAALKSPPYWMRDNKQYLNLEPAKDPVPGSPPPAAGAKKISTQFTRITSTVKKEVSHALQSIDKVHGDGDLDDIPFRKSRSNSYNAAFSHTFDGRAKEIMVGQKALAPELSIAHEMGHYLDLHSVGEKGKWNSLVKDSPIQKVIKVATDSDALKNIKSLLNDGYFMKDGEKVLLSPYAIKHLQYLYSPKEIWARSYSQYIAKKSGSAKMIKGLEDTAEFDKGRPYAHQWTDEDFEEISEAIDKMMAELGWIVNL